MSDVAIRVEGLSKRYRIGERQPYKTLRESLSAVSTRLFRGRRDTATETIWALEDVSFEIRRGEVVGVIGRNGAGKSTLLKILSRITEPTSGRAEVHGRVGSLLEVGTGFHNELTGRENVYLNGAILGMKRAEIARKFDEIVAFAEVERFIDTPVKHYSTGMYLRLAFAVAAHLEPEILLVDEVLAVGDAAFQNKCLGKMAAASLEGRTALFVSHNMAAINRLCRKALRLEGGRLVAIGAADETVRDYLAAGAASGAERCWVGDVDAPGDDRIRVRTLRLLDATGHVAATVEQRSEFVVEIEYQLQAPSANMQVGFWLHAADGTIVFVAGDAENLDYADRTRPPGIYRSRATVPGGLLNAGTYYLSLGIDMPLGSTVAMEPNAIQFEVAHTDPPRHSSHGSWKPPGILCLSLPWRIDRITDAHEQSPRGSEP